MFSRSHGIGYFLSSAVILLALLGAGCAHRYYDPDYRDYHRWNSSETVYYHQWQGKTTSAVTTAIFQRKTNSGIGSGATARITIVTAITTATMIGGKRPE